MRRIFAVFHDLFRALQGGHFLQGFLHARGDEAVEGIAGKLLVDLHDRRFRHAEEHLEIDGDLLEVGGVALGLVLGRLLPDGDLDRKSVV